ncbi:RNA polymerase sigma factor [Paraburkholderia sp. SIMBA_049]
MTGADLTGMLPHMLARLWAFALRLAGDTHDAEDLVQLACVRAIERAHQLKQNTAPLSWMFSIMQSVWISEVRARRVRHRGRIEWDDDFLAAVPDPDAIDPQEQALNAQIIRAVQELPEDQRVVMLLVAIEGLSCQEAADVLELPIGTVTSRLWRARNAIGAQFGTRNHHDMHAKTRGRDS